MLQNARVTAFTVIKGKPTGGEGKAFSLLIAFFISQT